MSSRTVVISEATPTIGPELARLLENAGHDCYSYDDPLPTKLDLLLHLHGPPVLPLRDDPDAWLDTLLMQPLHLCQRLLPRLAGGRFVVGALAHGPAEPVPIEYSALLGALRGFCRSLRAEQRGRVKVEWMEISKWDAQQITRKLGCVV